MVEYTAKRNRNRCPTHPGELLRDDVIPATGKTKTEIAALLGISRQHLSTPKQKCVGWPEQKYISEASKNAPEWGPFRQTSGLGRIIRRHIRAGTA